MLRFVAVICAIVLPGSLPGSLAAQTELSLGAMAIGTDSPVDIRADRLAVDQATAMAQLELLSDRLLANPVIENWSLERLEPAGALPA